MLFKLLIDNSNDKLKLSSFTCDFIFESVLRCLLHLGLWYVFLIWVYVGSTPGCWSVSVWLEIGGWSVIKNGKRRATKLSTFTTKEMGLADKSEV